MPPFAARRQPRAAPIAALRRCGGMAWAERQPRSGRIVTAIGAAAVQGLIGYALLVGLGFQASPIASSALKVFAVPAEPPPPQLVPKPAKKPAAAPQGGAGAPIVVPPAVVPLVIPPPVIAAVASGSSGTSAGKGAGTGAGDGAGEGGGGVHAERIRGDFRQSDFPRSARDAGPLAVEVEYMVEADGRVGWCRVTGSSGYAELDAVTCRVIQRRYRFEPARDAGGGAVAEVQGETQHWTPQEGR
jgi:protein TonB